MTEDKQTAWSNIKGQFLQVLGDHGLDDQAWAEMVAAAEVAGAGATTTTESGALFESFRTKFENEGFDVATARRMAREASAPRPGRAFG